MVTIEDYKLKDICNLLQSDEKRNRLKSLQHLHSILANSEKQYNTQELSEIWQTVNKYIIKCLTDTVESCRDKAIDIVKIFIKELPVVEKNIVYLIPILVRRLGSQETLEPSEEVRLNFIYLIRLLIQVYKNHMPVYINDLVIILSKTVTDMYPKVKKESCEAISELAEGASIQFYSICEPVIKPVISNFTHQHHRVRIASVKAIGQIIQFGNSKHMEEVATPLAERLFDQNAGVRDAVVQVAGDWLLNLRDKYSWWHKILPLLLTGLHDEIEYIRINAEKFWDATGVLYLKENESDPITKDKMDFLIQDPVHYPPKIKRPNLGCRLIIQNNIGKLVGAITRELNDWLADIRVRSAQLLAVIALNAEQNITHHIESLLPAMYRSCNDEDIRVVDNVILAAEYMGYFVPPETYCRLVLPTLDDENVKAGHIAIFAAILRGSENESLSEKLVEVGKFLQQAHICQSKKADYQYQMLKCCEALLNVCQQNCNVIVNELFIVIFTVWSMSQQERHQIFAQRLINILVNIIECKNSGDLYDRCLYHILIMIESTSPNWIVHSSEVYIFKHCLTEAKTASAKNINLIMPIIKVTVDKNSDPELRLKILILMSDFFQHRKQTLCNIESFSEFVKNFLNDILMPELIWTAGKTAEAIRTAAVGCLCALFGHVSLNPGENKLNYRFTNQEKETEISIDEENEENEHKLEYFTNHSDFNTMFTTLQPILLSLVDDNSRKTRFYALQALCSIINIGFKYSSISDENVMNIYPVVIKRLDDGADDVRKAAIEALVFVWRSLPENYDLEFGRSHIDYLYTTMIIHLDDPETRFQNLTLEALMELTSINPELLADKIIKSKQNFRNQKGLDELLEHCQKLLRTKN